SASSRAAAPALRKLQELRAELLACAATGAGLVDPLAGRGADAFRTIKIRLMDLRGIRWQAEPTVIPEGGRDPRTIRKQAAELVALAPDVILASGAAAVGPFSKATRARSPALTCARLALHSLNRSGSFGPV